MWSGLDLDEDTDALESLCLAAKAKRESLNSAEAASSSSSQSGQKRTRPLEEDEEDSSPKRVRPICDAKDVPTTKAPEEASAGSGEPSGISSLGTPILRSGGSRRVGLSRLTPRNVAATENGSSSSGASPTLKPVIAPRVPTNKPFKPPARTKPSSLAKSEGQQLSEGQKYPEIQDAEKSASSSSKQDHWSTDTSPDAFDLLIQSGALDDLE